MNYISLGKSNIHISEVSFGTMSLKGAKSHDKGLVRKAFDSGINYFDTADLYDKGENEKLIGEALKEIRSKVVIGTKVGNQLRADGSGWDWNPRKSYILSAVDESLRRLQTDYIDYYQLHGGTLEDPMDETIEAFERLKEQGKIREYGISSIRPNVIREYVKRSNIAGVMMQYSLLDRRPEEACFDLLQQAGIPVLVRGGYAKGILLDKAPQSFLSWSVKEVEQMMEGLKELVPALDIRRSWVLHFALAHPAVGSVVSGIRTPDQLAETLEAYMKEIPHENWYQDLNQTFPAKTYQDHR